MDAESVRYRVASADGTREQLVIIAEAIDELLEPHRMKEIRQRITNRSGSKMVTAAALHERHLQSTDVRQVFDHWKRVMQKNGNVRLTDERRKKIQARLKDGYAVADIKKAIDGCSRSDFHMARGEYRGGNRYDDLTLILRNGSRLEGFRDNAGGDGKADMRAFL